MAEITICVGNYSAYGAGYLIDEWFELPMQDSELKDRLKRIQNKSEALTGDASEEFYISDIDNDLFGLPALDIQYLNIDNLNVLAKIMQFHDFDDGAVRTAFEQGGYRSGSEQLLALANLIINSDEIPYYPYTYTDSYSAEENLARTILDATEELDSDKYIYFDFEKYGRDLSMDYILGDEGFLDACDSLPDGEYSWEEIVEIASEYRL